MSAFFGKLMKYTYGHDPGMPFICPYCFESIKKIDDVHYMCTAVGHSSSSVTEEDPEFARYRGLETYTRTTHVIRTFNKKDPRCDVCGARLTRMLCPVCHNTLPYGIDKWDLNFFAVLGPRAVGKSHYIGVLIKVLEKMSREFEWSISPIDSKVNDLYNKKYANSLFSKKNTIEPTRRVTLDIYEPLAYTIKTFNGKVAGLFFVDTAGEDVSADDYAYTIQKYISNSSGIIYLVDPLQFDYVRDRIGSRDTNKANYTNTLSVISQVYRSGKGVPVNKKIDIPIAVVVTKCDVLLKDPTSEMEEEVFLGSDSAMNNPRKYGVFDDENSRQISAEIEGFLDRVSGGTLPVAVKNDYKEYRYFAVSALGSEPDPSGMLGGVSPIRVEDPMLWLLHKETNAIRSASAQESVKKSIGLFRRRLNV